EITIKIHVQNILKKLHLTSRVQAAVYAVEHGLAQKD
ncbi:MAG: LuxR C-terminal-related transcriptional regulator, partial [Sulfuricella sp.]|nr:LuxR C-terminal-related transcriptional regulator [Sulfuricella sp.]